MPPPRLLAAEAVPSRSPRLSFPSQHLPYDSSTIHRLQSVSNRVLVISVPSIARYTALWLLAMAVVLWTPWWREADWRVFGLPNKSNTPSWPQQWVIVDVPYEDADGDPTVFRRRSARLAAIRERQRPRMVILDVYFSSDPVDWMCCRFIATTA